MGFDRTIHNRRTIRLPDYDYTQPGAYFITIAIHRREQLLGEIASGVMNCNRYGEIVQYSWLDLASRYPNTQIAHFCVMPNHFHGSIELIDMIPGKQRHPLSEIVRGFKSASANRVNKLRSTPGYPVWQRDYYENIIRNAREFQAIADYIETNSLNWDQDAENQPGLITSG